MSDFQARGAAQGAQFENICRLILEGVGFDVSDKSVDVPELGIEIDIEATNRHGIKFWFECKGSWMGSRQALRRTDTVKKAIASGLLLDAVHGDYPRFVILTTHLPQPGFRGDVMLRVALDCGAVYDAILIDDSARLKQLAEVDA
jgi:hypothetical protein